MTLKQILLILALPTIFCLGVLLWQANPLFILVPLGLAGIALIGFFIAFIISAELTSFEAWDLLIRSVLFRLGFKVNPPKSLDDEEHEHEHKPQENPTDLNQLLESMMKQTGAERGYIALVNPESGALEFQMGRGIDKASISSLELTISEEVAKNREAVVTTNASQDPRFSSSSSIVGHSLRSVLAAPLIVDDKLVGVVYVDSRISAGLFSNDTLKALTDFVQENAQAIEKASQTNEQIKPPGAKTTQASHVVDRDEAKSLPSPTSAIEPEPISKEEDTFGGDYDDDFDMEDEEEVEEVPTQPSVSGTPPDFENMSPEELMKWVESMAVRSGIDSEKISDNDPRLTNPEYIPGLTEEMRQEYLARQREKKEAEAVPVQEIEVPKPVSPITEASIPEEAEPSCLETQFTAYYPRQAAAKTEYGFYVYAHVQDALIESDVKAFSAELGGRIPKAVQASESACLKEGALLAVMLHCDKLKFNQMGAMQVWKAPFVRFDFKFTADEALIDEIIEGRVAVMLGMIEIASIDFKISVGAANPLAVVNALPEKPTLSLDASPSVPPYQKIFVSYSRKDMIVAEHYRAAQTMLGNSILMDVHSIRAGEDWDSALKRFISEADVFQLFWSEHSAISDHVRFEWEYALKQRCPDTLCRQFIRPTYWQRPMPAVPEALNHLHFAYVDVQSTESKTGDLS